MKNILRYMAYATMFMGALASLLGLGKFLVFISSKGLAAIIAYLFVAMMFMLCIILIGLLTVSLIEMTFGDKDNPYHQKILKEVNDMLDGFTN